MKRHNGLFCMILGLLLLAAAFVYAGLNFMEERTGGEAAQNALMQLQSAMPTALPEPAPTEETEQEPPELTVMDAQGEYVALEDVLDALNIQEDEDAAALKIEWIKGLFILGPGDIEIPWPTDENDLPMSWANIQGAWPSLAGTSMLLHPTPTPEPLYITNPGISMPVIFVENEKYVGVLDIPALGFSLPVMQEWSYPRLKIAPCRYRGSIYTGDMIICGHNYERHFGLLKTLNKGDVIRFTDNDGNVFVYNVKYFETIEETHIWKMNAGTWDLTLFTCNPGGKTRMTVRCELIETVPK